jgi:MOSC domain-containing protein YiiM
MDDHGLLEAVSVGRPRLATYRGRTVSSAIWKQPVAGRVEVRGVNVAGDDQADRSVHGGPDKAIYAYAAEDSAWWEPELDAELGPGAFGENLTTRGVDLSQALVGERWAVGSTLLEVSQPRLPCFKLGLRHGRPELTRRFARALRPGAYLRILQEGEIGAGDRIEVVWRPDHDVTMELTARAYLFDHELLPHVLDAPALPAAWRA